MDRLHTYKIASKAGNNTVLLNQLMLPVKDLRTKDFIGYIKQITKNFNLLVMIFHKNAIKNH